MTIVLGIFIVWVCFIIYKLNNKINALEKKYSEQTNRDKIKNNIIYYPTSEQVKVSISLDPGNILCYFFPNSFKDAKEALNYYIDFANSAEIIGEDEEIYKILYSYNLDINIDILSGNITFYNSTTKLFNPFISFNMFHYNKIKSTNLKSDIEKLLDKNHNFLEMTGLLKIFSSGKYIFVDSLAVLPIGIFPNDIRIADYSESQAYWNENYNKFTLPVEDILNILRIARTYDFGDEKSIEIINNKKERLRKLYPDVKYELNFEKYSARVSNNFMSVNIYVKYFYPIQKIEQFITGRSYYSPDVDFWS